MKDAGAPGLSAARGAREQIVTPPDYAPIDRRTVFVSGIAGLLAIGAGLAAEVLTRLIGLVTNAAFYGRLSDVFVMPGGGHRAPLVILLVPVAGAIVVGLMARFGSSAIRGHGIPEVMEKVLFGESRIPARVLFLKPVSAAIAIGTGGPFGAEGPIIATGGALGSVAGQMLTVTVDERKTLLAAGAAAGMAATFGSPVSAVLLAVELLLFEYRARSLVPVALAAAVAAGVRIAFHGTAPVFGIADLGQSTSAALAFYALIGLVIGAVAAGITRLTFYVEDLFEKVGHRLGIHWMWWPAIGALVVGIVGLVEPRTLGVGYGNITGAISGDIVGRALIVLALLKLTSWVIYLSSGTSGGTMAPLFTIGSGIGAWLGAGIVRLAPGYGVNPQVAGLVGMAALFAGASHALLASVVFAFETTRQSLGLLPLLVGCTAAYLVSLMLNRHSIMTEKLARRGASLRPEYSLDHLAHVLVREEMTEPVVTLRADETIANVRAWLATRAEDTAHQGFPVLDEEGLVCGVVTRRDLLDPAHDEVKLIRELLSGPAVVVFEDSTLRDAADQMVVAQVGRLPVVSRAAPRRLLGIVSRSDLLAAHAPRLRAAREVRHSRPFSFRRAG